MELALDYRIYKSYHVLDRIGNGAYGEVYHAIDKKSQRGVAIKKITDAFQNLTDAKRTYRQLCYLLQLEHPCIVKLHRVIQASPSQCRPLQPNKDVYAVFELMELDLAKTINLCEIELVQRKFLNAQILVGLEYLHSCQLVHRDIKPSNILVDNACNAKICDFGLVRKTTACGNQPNQQQIFTEYVASRLYRAPEILLNGSRISTTYLDMWSFGCVMAEMVVRHPIFNGKNTIDQLQKIMVYLGMPVELEIQEIACESESASYLLKNFHPLQKKQLRELLMSASQTTCPEEVDLIEKLLVFNPVHRISASEALQHPYFTEIAELVASLRKTSVPVQIFDHSETSVDQSLNKYRHLIEQLCINTFRVSHRTSNSKDSFSCTHNSAEYRSNELDNDHSSDHILTKPNVNMLAKYEIEDIQQYFPVSNADGNQQKSTRQSNRGCTLNNDDQIQKHVPAQLEILNRTCKSYMGDKKKPKTRLSLLKKQYRNVKDGEHSKLDNQLQSIKTKNNCQFSDLNRGRTNKSKSKHKETNSSAKNRSKSRNRTASREHSRSNISITSNGHKTGKVLKSVPSSSASLQLFKKGTECKVLKKKKK